MNTRAGLVVRDSEDFFPCRIGEETTTVGNSMLEDESKVKMGSGGERAPCEAAERRDRSSSGVTKLMSKSAKEGQEDVDGDIMKESMAGVTGATGTTNYQ